MSYAIGAAIQRSLAGLVGGRVHPVILPDAPVYPIIRYTNVSTNHNNTLCGPSNLTDSRYRIDVFAQTIKEAEQISASVKSIMRGGSLGFQNTPLMDMDGYEPTVGIYRKTLDFQIWEAETMA